MVKIEGKYRLEKSDNFDAFLKELGLNFITRGLATSAVPTITITANGDEFTIRNETTMKTSVINFKLGVEFEEERADGATVKSVITKASDEKLVHIQKGSDKEVKIIREFSDDGFTLTMSVNGVTTVRFYKRI